MCQPAKGSESGRMRANRPDPHTVLIGETSCLNLRIQFVGFRPTSDRQTALARGRNGA